MPLIDKLKNKDQVLDQRGTAPLWKGPEIDGVTQSLLGRFLVCRERFRIAVVEGLRPAEDWNHRIGYGGMWHVCEEVLAAGNQPDNKFDQWTMLTDYCKKLCRQYPTQQAEISKWYNVCKVQFPVYVHYWHQHPDVTSRTPLMQEQVFNVPYELPSGRVVRLRGKYDSVDLVGKGKDRGCWLQENKTKGDINETLLLRQLTFDLQTMFYLTALYNDPAAPVEVAKNLKGVRYNVIRRPLSGGKGTIVQHKPSKSNPRGETEEEYYTRLGQYIKDEPHTYFYRWNVLISKAEVNTFCKRCLDPILEQLWDWWIDQELRRLRPEWQGINKLHWQHPFGVYNPMDEGRASDLDNYLATGSTVGLKRMDTLFPELA